MKLPILMTRQEGRRRLAEVEKASLDIIPIITRDIQEFCARISVNPHDSCSARAVTRCYLSLVETIVYFLKQQSLILYESGLAKAMLCEEEIAFLRGERREIKRGILKVIIMRKEFLDRVKLALIIRSKVVGIEFSIDFNDEGWQKFVIASKIRDRLTHPSNIGDVDLPSKDYDTVAQAAGWFLKQQKNLDELLHAKDKGNE